MNTKSNRRQFLKWGSGAAGAIALTSNRALAATCGVTPPQTAGPFYPGDENFSEVADLTTVPGSNKRAEGQIIFIEGMVTDDNCQPIENANVEIWQASASGRYNNSRDPNPAPLDPNFKYWAEAFTGQKGEYLFKTIIPGAYPATNEWTRPPHIHFRISALGYQELITQMYFKGNELNDGDLILQNIPRGQRQNVLVDFQPSPSHLEPGSLFGKFNITLQKVPGA